MTVFFNRHKKKQQPKFRRCLALLRKRKNHIPRKVPIIFCIYFIFSWKNEEKILSDEPPQACLAVMTCQPDTARVKTRLWGSPISFSGCGISFIFIWGSGFGILKRNRGDFVCVSMCGRWDAKSNPRDYGIARNLGSGLRDRKTLLGTLDYEPSLDKRIFPTALIYN